MYLVQGKKNNSPIELGVWPWIRTPYPPPLILTSYLRAIQYCTLNATCNRSLPTLSRLQCVLPVYLKYFMRKPTNGFDSNSIKLFEFRNSNNSQKYSNFEFRIRIEPELYVGIQSTLDNSVGWELWTPYTIIEGNTIIVLPYKVYAYPRSVTEFYGGIVFLSFVPGT